MTRCAVRDVRGSIDPRSLNIELDGGAVGYVYSQNLQMERRCHEPHAGTVGG